MMLSNTDTKLPVMDITTAYNEETRNIHILWKSTQSQAGHVLPKCRDTTFCVSVFDSLAMHAD
uniref:Uncharacterized protein n=1 Tax=Brassica oleracea TaxID=3712 RepID=A0A3P6FA05_BRAOL|nr:unnamed protein product [Brassica oleracea]